MPSEKYIQFVLKSSKFALLKYLKGRPLFSKLSPDVSTESSWKKRDKKLETFRRVRHRILQQPVYRWVHRPHTRQVTGVRCTEVAARQSWAEYSSRPTTDCRYQGWAIKDFSVSSEMCSICEQPLHGIILIILHTNKWCVLISDQHFQIFSKSIWKIPSASGHSRSPFTSCRTCPSWHNGSSLGPHVLNAYGSMTLATTNTIYGKHDPALVDMWGTSYQKMEYQSSLRRPVITGGSEKAVRVSRRMDCRIDLIKFHVSANN